MEREEESTNKKKAEPKQEENGERNPYKILVSFWLKSLLSPNEKAKVIILDPKNTYT